MMAENQTSSVNRCNTYPHFKSEDQDKEPNIRIDPPPTQDLRTTRLLLWSNGFIELCEAGNELTNLETGGLDSADWV